MIVLVGGEKGGVGENDAGRESGRHAPPGGP